MNRLYLQDSYRRDLETFVRSVEIVDGRTALLCEDLLFHPEGGGQPDDLGAVVIRGQSHQVQRLTKRKGDVLIVLNAQVPEHEDLAPGESIACVLNWERRHRLMRMHTGAHVLMAAARRNLAGYVPRGIVIEQDGKECVIRFTSDDLLTDAHVGHIVTSAQEAVSADLNVQSRSFPDMEAAKAAYGDLFRADPNLLLRGRVRIVDIEGFDANPCGGTHLGSLREIGAIGIRGITSGHNDEPCRLTFSITP